MYINTVFSLKATLGFWESERKWNCSVVSDFVSHPMDCSLPGSSIYGVFQAKVLEWVAISFSKRRAFSGFGTTRRDSSGSEENAAFSGWFFYSPGRGLRPPWFSIWFCTDFIALQSYLHFDLWDVSDFILFFVLSFLVNNFFQFQV